MGNSTTKNNFTLNTDKKDNKTDNKNFAMMKDNKTTVKHQKIKKYKSKSLDKVLKEGQFENKTKENHSKEQKIICETKIGNQTTEINKVKKKKNEVDDYLIKEKNKSDNKQDINDSDIHSKPENKDNNDDYNDIEINLNINNCNKYLDNISVDEEDDEDNDNFEGHNKEKESNELSESYISLDLMNKDENIKYNLDIIWIDEKVNNSENQSYLEKMKKDYPNIKITVYDNLEQGFNEILQLEFVSIFVIVSGRLYSQYYHKLEENLVKIKCIPINLIFTSSIFKKILERKEPDTEQIISYDIQKSINNSFYNSGGVFDDYEEVANYLNKFNSNFSKKQINGKLYNLSYEGLFTFNYLKSDTELLAPILYKDIITKKKILYDEIKKFNDFLLSYGNTDINYLIEPLSLLKKIPIEIISKYWTRVYTIESKFYRELNNRLMKSDIQLYDIYIRTLYFGLDSNSLFSNVKDKLYRGSMIGEDEIEKIINCKNQKVMVFCKAFLSFSNDPSVATDFLKRSSTQEGSSHVFYELNPIDKNEIDNYNISNIMVKDYSVIKNENEILFLPGSSFEIKDIQKSVNIDGINTCKITLGYIGKFNKDFYEIYNNPKKINELTKNSEIIKPIMEYFFSDKDLLSFDNDKMQYYNNGKYILSKILINIDINFAYWMQNNSNVGENDNNLMNIKKLLNDTIFPCYLLKNRYNNNYYIANLFYKINTPLDVYETNINFIHNLENPYSLKCVDNFEDDYFYYVVYEYYDETLEDFIKRYRKHNYTMPVNFIHKILTQLNVCFEKMVKLNRFHKDIKPGNIYIIYTNEEKDNFDIRLGGFILSVDEEKSNHSSCSMGNDNFKAPESSCEGKHDKCDLWSIGVLIYYLYFLKPLKDPFNYKKPIDEDLADLVQKLIVYKAENRMNWKNYFSHPFFKKYK